jgi:PEP-CTERM motif
MRNRLICLLTAFLLVGGCMPYAHADEAIGYMSFLLSNPPNQGEFDVVNLTGVNSSGDASFPVSTQLNFSGLSLTGGTGTTFSLNADGISWDGSLVSAATVGALTSVTLTGTLSPTTVTLFDSSVVTLNGSFSATLTDSKGIKDGDLVVIYASTGGGGGGSVPEPESLVLVATGFAGLAGLRRRVIQAVMKKASGRALSVVAVFAGLLLVSAGARSQVKLNAWTVPSSGLSGSSVVALTGSGFPNPINASAATVTFAATCGGAVLASEAPSLLSPIIGSTDRMQFPIPSGLATGTYFVAVSGMNAASTTFSSTNCAEVNVTAVTTTLSACVPTSSLAVTVGTNVTAYVPFGYWDGGTSGIEQVPLEGSGGTAHFATPGVVNSCASNSATAEVVCSENTKNVDLINGTTLTTITSGSNTSASFSGGSCQNCGVAINPTDNTAVIAMGITGGSGDGVQVLNLSNNTFNTPFPMSHEVSENVSIDSSRGLLLSPGESGNYTLLKIGAGDIFTEFGMQIGGTLDSAAEDCTTGIALAADEFTDDIFITDLTQAVFTPGSPSGTWTAPGQFINLNDGGYSAGTSGITSAPGTNHLAVVTGEFGGSAYSALKLPSTSGSGTPTLADYAYVSSMPNTPDGIGFSAGFDPHTITAYTSPNSGKSYAVFVDYATGTPSYLGVVDLACVLAQPRTAGTHNVIGNASTCTRYVAVP